MKHFNGQVYVGLRDRETNKLIAPYPTPVEGTYEEVNKKVRDWYYKKSCEAEDAMQNYYIDVLTENETKAVTH